MLSQVPVIDANLATVCLESALYGIFLLLFITSTALTVHRHRYTRHMWHRQVPAGSIKPRSFLNPMFLASIALALTVTAHWILTADRLFLAQVHFRDGSAPLAFYADQAQPTAITKIGLLVVTLAIADGIFVYRLWIVWNHNKWVPIFPICTIVGLLICGTGVVVQFTKFVPGETAFLAQANRWISSNSAFTLATNVYCTGMISWRIWSVNRQSSGLGNHTTSLGSVLAILIESAAIIMAQTTFFTIAYHLGSNLQIIAISIWSPVCGIAFMLINCRVGLGWAQTAYKPNTLPETTMRFGHSSSGGHDHSFAMNAVKVEVNTGSEPYSDSQEESSKGFRVHGDV
ncbi:hypothetical protein DFH07DRAFT_844461 [Mycena maculata]|uniref:Uncharacterized protein n=1 Tax=Mycena maculata TaxID=230809 RepID=A0AAD7MX82_9AGAR|nr:hypothetical protein DFH07DRAFT_844461 [Mycena maculata]